MGELTGLADDFREWAKKNGEEMYEAGFDVGSRYGARMAVIGVLGIMMTNPERMPVMNVTTKGELIDLFNTLTKEITEADDFKMNPTKEQNDEPVPGT